MNTRDKLYTWWKKQPKTVRKPFVFVLGLVLIITAPLVGWIPGPGGIIAFLAGIAVLASEFDWARGVESFFLHTVPKKVRKHWQPTPKWEATFDATAFIMLVCAGVFAYNRWWAPVLSFGIGGFCIFLFNRSRLDRMRASLRKKQ